MIDDGESGKVIPHIKTFKVLYTVECTICIGHFKRPKAGDTLHCMAATCLLSAGQRLELPLPASTPFTRVCSTFISYTYRYFIIFVIIITINMLNSIITNLTFHCPEESKASCIPIGDFQTPRPFYKQKSIQKSKKGQFWKKSKKYFFLIPCIYNYSFKYK